MTAQSDNNFQEVGEDFLAHFGKKGMRWGVSNGTPSSGSSSNKVSVAKSVAKNVAKTTALVTINAGAGYAFGLLGVVGAQVITGVVRNQINLHRMTKAAEGDKFAQKKLKTKVSRVPNRLGATAGVGSAITFAALRIKDFMALSPPSPSYDQPPGSWTDGLEI